ncbi:MAG: hypothetical protein IPO25_20335 [Saprospiraceae bacterium]|nr:hypothetical protein [Saprospiraceae bacterium]
MSETAILVKGHTARVYGESQVIVIEKSSWDYLLQRQEIAHGKSNFKYSD